MGKNSIFAKASWQTVWNIAQEAAIAGVSGAAISASVMIVLFGQGIVSHFAIGPGAQAGMVAGLLLGVIRGIRVLGPAASAMAGGATRTLVWAVTNLPPILKGEAVVRDNGYIVMYFGSIFLAILVSGGITGAVACSLSRKLRTMPLVSSGDRIASSVADMTRAGEPQRERC